MKGSFEALQVGEPDDSCLTVATGTAVPNQLDWDIIPGLVGGKLDLLTKRNGHNIETVLEGKNESTGPIVLPYAFGINAGILVLIVAAINIYNKMQTMHKAKG